MKRSIAIYGGSFNPITCGHVMACHWALMTGSFDKIYVIPAYQHQFKKELIDFEHRLNMLHLAYGHLQQYIEISPVERTLGNSVTFDTVKYLDDVMRSLGIVPNFTVLIGSDLIDELPRWSKINDLRAIANFSVIDRSIYASGVSSTNVRNAVKEGNIDYLKSALPQSVLSYIQTHNLYS
jgi:nicotinate-nucleotide adenylyltransferase